MSTQVDLFTTVEPTSISGNSTKPTVSCRFEILRASYWEHFKAAKDLALYLEPTHPKRLRLEKELNKMLAVLNCG